jgi:hypothetical protein
LAISDTSLTGNGISLNAAPGAEYLCYNNTVIGGFNVCLVYAGDGTGGSEIVNNVAYAGRNISYLPFGGTVAVQTNNASWFPADSETQIGEIANVDFVNIKTGRYAAAIGGKLDSTGADLSGTFDNDIKGSTRPVGAFDVGAYIAAPHIPISNMYNKDPITGQWLSSAPFLHVGGVWQEVDAYVLVNGAWVAVHERA